jgi:hypothetical protein
VKSTSSLWAWIITIGKSVLRATLDRINRDCRNGFFQRVAQLYSMQFHLLRCIPNGPMASFWSINTLLTIRECQSNDHNASNGYISLPWRSAILCCTDISTKFEFWKPFFCEVFSRTYYNFSNFSLFLLIFLAFFPVI